MFGGASRIRYNALGELDERARTFPATLLTLQTSYLLLSQQRTCHLPTMLPSLLDPIEDGQPSYDSFMESVGVDDYLSSREALPLTSPWDFGNGPICSNINALGFAPDFTSTLSQCSGTLEYALASSWMLSVHEEEILYSLPSAV